MTVFAAILWRPRRFISAIKISQHELDENRSSHDFSMEKYKLQVKLKPNLMQFLIIVNL